SSSRYGSAAKAGATAPRNPISARQSRCRWDTGKKTPSGKPLGVSLRLSAGLDRSRVLRQLVVRAQNLPQGHDAVVGGASRREDHRDVRLHDATERGAVLLANADQVCERVERLAVADGHVASQAVLVAVDEHRGLPGRAHYAILGAAGCASGDAERLVARGAVGGHGENLRRDAALTVEQLGAPAAGADVVLLSKRKRGYRGNHNSDKDFS